MKQSSKYMLLIMVSGIFATSVFAQVTAPVTTSPPVTTPVAPQVSSTGEVKTEAEGTGKHKKQKGERKAKKHGLVRANEVAGEHGKAGRDNARAKQNREQD